MRRGVLTTLVLLAPALVGLFMYVCGAHAQGCETFKVTAYTYTGSRTASGVYPYEGSVAVYSNGYANPRFPYGSTIYIGGKSYTVTDTGSGLGWNHVDIFMDSRAAAIQWGVKYLEVCF